MEQHIELDGTYMNIIKFGKGQKILTIIAGVSLCGLEGLGKQLENALSIFNDDFTILVFDRKKVIPKGYTILQMAEDIFSCLSLMGIEKTSIYGTSQGGMIGQVLAIHHPEFVEKLVLCSTAAKNGNDNKAFNEWKKASNSGDVVKLNSLFLEYVYSDAFKESIKDSIPALLKQGTPDDLKRFTILIESMEDFDITDQLNKIKCPSLVIVDKQDKVFNYTSGTLIAEKIGSKTIIYDKYSHAVYDEAPDLKEKILEFLK